MKIALCSDELYPFHESIKAYLLSLGHDVELFGALKSGQDASWVLSTYEAAQTIVSGKCAEGIFCCWTGTGASIVANKVSQIRAALCCDPETALGARVWNHANVLVLSNRLLKEDNGIEILKAWFAPFDREKGKKAVELLATLDKRLIQT